MDGERQTLADRYVTVDGLRLRLIEAGQGPAVLFLHGASLGSSADVFRRNLPAFAAAGFRAIAFDMPGFGRSDMPTDHSLRARRALVPKLMDALGVTAAALVGHSQAGTVAVSLALQDPALFTRLVVLGTGSLLPPLPGGAPRPERNVPEAEPSLTDTRAALEATLVHRELATPDEVELRHSYCIGRHFAAAVARAGTKEAPEAGPPLWQRLTELKAPLLMIYGRQDRAQAAARAALLKEEYPQLDLHLIDGCHHLVPWDAAEEFARLTVKFLKVLRRSHAEDAMSESENILETATIKWDGDVREAGPKGRPVEVYVVETTAGLFWFETYVDYAENGNDFHVTVRNFGLRRKVSAGSRTPLGRRSFSAVEAKAAQSRLQALFSGPRDNPHLPLIPFRRGKGRFLGLHLPTGWITIK